VSRSVWLVTETDGFYDGLQVHAVFLSEHDAQMWVLVTAAEEHARKVAQIFARRNQLPTTRRMKEMLRQEVGKYDIEEYSISST
jgi:hypothetical protein